MALAKLMQEAGETFTKIFGHQPDYYSSAPGRVNLIGEHIDYCDGLVLPAAIDRYIVIAFRKTDSLKGEICMHSAGNMTEIPLDVELITSEPEWANYVRGIIDGFHNIGYHDIPGFQAYIHSNLPRSSGLSSTSALECCTAHMVEQLIGVQLDKTLKAILCQRAEHSFAGVPCGIMNPYVTIFSKQDHLISLDCRDISSSYLPFPTDELALIVANTKKYHHLNDGSYASRRRQVDDTLSLLEKESWRDVTMAELEARQDDISHLAYKRSRHVIAEIERSKIALAAWNERDYDHVGQLMNASHQSLQHDYEATCYELDVMANIAQTIGHEGGVLGSKMTGGGFGGSTITLVRKDSVRHVMEEIYDKYRIATHQTPMIFCPSIVAGSLTTPAAEV